MSYLNVVCDGILDDAAKEYIKENSTKEGINEYAESVGIYLSEIDIKKIHRAISWYMRYNGVTMENDYFFNVTKPLW